MIIQWGSLVWVCTCHNGWKLFLSYNNISTIEWKFQENIYTRDSPFWGRSFHNGRHVCLLINNNSSILCLSYSKKLTRYSAVWCHRFPIGQHICLLIILNPYGFMFNFLTKCDKGLPCFRPYMTHWIAHLSLRTNKYLHNVQFICTKIISWGITLIKVVYTPLSDTFLIIKLSPRTMTNLSVKNFCQGFTLFWDISTRLADTFFFS